MFDRRRPSSRDWMASKRQKALALSQKLRQTLPFEYEEHGPWEYVIPVGSFLYHATAKQKNFRIPKRLAWFTEKKHIAQAFLESGLREAGFILGKRPRVLVFETKRPLIMVELDDYTLLDELPPNEEEGFYTKGKAFCKEYGYDGWIIPCVYDIKGLPEYPAGWYRIPAGAGFGDWPINDDPESSLECGADILLCGPTSSALALIDQILLPGR